MKPTVQQIHRRSLDNMCCECDSFEPVRWYPKYFYITATYCQRCLGPDWSKAHVLRPIVPTSKKTLAWRAWGIISAIFLILFGVIVAFFSDD